MKMTPEEQAIVDQKLREVADILYSNTPERELETFETIELSVRDHLLKTVAPKIGEFFPFSSRNKFRKREKGKKLSWSNNYFQQASYQIEAKKRNSFKSPFGEVLPVTCE